MAWRIQESIHRGEIDNRQRGVVRGRLWLHGRAKPIILDLQGNACPDLAGCLLTFENPNDTIPLPPDAPFATEQRGTIGDLTASRKVRVWDLPFKEAYARTKKGLLVPEHWANCLYLEWFSSANGRVVIESADCRLTISPPAWTLTPEEEQQRQDKAREGFAGFMDKLSAALEKVKQEPREDQEWDEFDYEKLLRESDACSEKYAELLDKYRDHPERDRIIAKEMGWDGVEENHEEEEAGNGLESAGIEVPDDLPDLEPDPTTEGVDWVRDKDGGINHPLTLRAFTGSLDLWQECKARGLDKLEDPDLGTLLDEFQITSAKLAGALNGLAYGRDHQEAPFIVACLKRALGHLHAALTALAKVAGKALLPAPTINATRAELLAVRTDILRLMEEFRRDSV